MLGLLWSQQKGSRSCRLQRTDWTGALFSGLVFCASTLAADVDAESYGYPLANPFEATIATTPPELRPALPADADIRQRDYSVRLRPDRQFELLENFWPVTRLRYRLAEQKGRAPAVRLPQPLEVGEQPQERGSAPGAREDDDGKEKTRTRLSPAGTAGSGSGQRGRGSRGGGGGGGAQCVGREAGDGLRRGGGADGRWHRDDGFGSRRLLRLRRRRVDPSNAL